MVRDLDFISRQWEVFKQRSDITVLWEAQTGSKCGERLGQGVLRGAEAAIRSNVSGSKAVTVRVKNRRWCGDDRNSRGWGLTACERKGRARG